MSPLKRRNLKRPRIRKSKDPSQQSPDKDTDIEWAAHEILAESSAEYLIDWEPNSDTGEKYSPTWEPKRNASKTLIKSWKRDRLPQSSLTKEIFPVTSLKSTTSQQSSFLKESLCCSASSSHRANKRNSRKRQVKGRGRTTTYRKLRTQQKNKQHICSSTEDSDSETVKTINKFSTGIEVVGSTPYCSESEFIEGPTVVNVSCTSAQPAANVRVSERGLIGSYPHVSGRESAIASQLIETNSTCFIENSASSSSELLSQENQVTLLPDEQPHSCKSITSAPHLNSAPSHNLHESIDEIPESWADKNSRELLTVSLDSEARATKLSEVRVGGCVDSRVSDEQNLLNETLPSVYANNEYAQGVRYSLNSYVTDHPTADPSFLSERRISQSAQELLSLRQLPTQSCEELNSLILSDVIAQDFVSSTNPDEISNASPLSLNRELGVEFNDELRSSVSENEFTPIGSTLNPLQKNPNQNSSFRSHSTILQIDEEGFSHQTRVTSLYSQKESFESTFETLSALASSYATPEPGNQPFSSNPACETLSPSSAAEISQGHHTRSTSNSLCSYPQHQTSPIFGDKSNVLVLAPTLLSELQGNVRSSNSEDISTPFKTQISISEHSLHNIEPALADSNCIEKTKSWEHYIQKKFGISTSDRPSPYQGRVLNLLKVLNKTERISYWKADALTLLFVAINPNEQNNCNREITSLARELYNTVCGVNGNIALEGIDSVATEPLFLSQGNYERLIKKHNAPLAVEGENQITLDNTAVQQSGQVMERIISPNIEMKDKDSLLTTRDRNMQSPASSVGDYEVADVVVSTSLIEPLLEEEEYILPLPMQGTTAQQYRDIIPYYSTNIKRFTSKKRQKAKLELRPVKRLFEHLNNITYHVDLENDRAFTQETVSKSIQAKWDETCSSKFRVLGGIFDDLKNENVHIALTLRSGKPVTILKNWLNSKKITFNASRGGKAANLNMPVAESLFVSIITDETDSVIDKVPDVDAIFSLDDSFAMNHKKRKELQAKSNIPSRPAPIISFIIFASQEHISRCIPASLSEIEHLQVLASYVSNWRLSAGKLPSEAREIIDCTSLISHWLLARTEKGRAQNPDLDATVWPVPLIDKTDNGVTAEKLPLVSPPKDTHYSLKRSNDQIDDIEHSKRVRISSQSAANNRNDVSITHISETNLASSQHNQNLEQQSSFGDKKSSQVDKSTDARIILLREQLQLAKEKVKDLEDASEDIQRRYDKQSSDISKLQEENKQLRSSCEHEKSNNIELAEAVGDAFAETQKLQEQEKQSEAGPAKPGIIGILDTEIQFKELREERDKLEKKVKKQDEELDFIRERYREASDAAMKSTQQATSFENALRDAQRRASGEAARLKQMHYSNYTSRLEDENKSLRALNENLTDLLRRKDDELKTLRARAILSTRAGSIPRSPRIGPSGNGSRAGSPPTPKPHHPLRTL